MDKTNLLRKNSGKQPKLYAIAYLDSLGTTEKIKSKDDVVHLNKLYEIYTLAVNLAESETRSSKNYSDIKTKIFSDNIVIAKPLRTIPQNKAEDIRCLLDFVSLFQNNAVIEHSWLIRGGITIGELFVDKVMIWGKGLIRAYKLESELAFYPRIILDQDIIGYANQFDERYASEDIDGFYYLDFLNRNNKAEMGKLSKNIKLSYNQMLEEIKRDDGTYPDKPYQKLQWYKNYVNNWYRLFLNNNDTKDLLSDAFVDLRRIG